MPEHDIVDTTLDSLSDIICSLFWLSTVVPEGAALLKVLAERLEQNLSRLDQALEK